MDPYNLLDEFLTYNVQFFISRNNHGSKKYQLGVLNLFFFNNCWSNSTYQVSGAFNDYGPASVALLWCGPEGESSTLKVFTICVQRVCMYVCIFEIQVYTVPLSCVFFVVLFFSFFFFLFFIRWLLSMCECSCLCSVCMRCYLWPQRFAFFLLSPSRLKVLLEALRTALSTLCLFFALC